MSAWLCQATLLAMSSLCKVCRSQALTGTVMGLFLVYVLLWAFFVARAQARLKTKSYQKCVSACIRACWVVLQGDQGDTAHVGPCLQ